MARLQFWENTCFQDTFKRVQRELLSESKGTVIPCRWTENKRRTHRICFTHSVYSLPWSKQRQATEPRKGLNTEVELDSDGDLDCPLLQVPTAACPDSAFVTLFRTGVERASCEVHKLLPTGKVLCEPVWSSGKAGKQRDFGSNPLRLSLFFKSCGLWTLSCDFVPHNE